MKKEIIIISFIIIVGYIKYSWALGQSSGYTLLKEPSARAAGLGSACGGILKDASLVLYNPASVAFLENNQIIAMYQRGFAKERGIASFIYGKPKLAVGLFYYDLGDLEFYNTKDELIKVAAEVDFYGVLTYGLKITENLGLGGALKLLQSELVEYKKATSYMIDLGILLKLKRLIAGVSLQNIGTKLKYQEVKENLPTGFRLSFACRPFLRKLLLSFDIMYLFKDKKLLPAIGLEHEAFDRLTLRLGHKFKTKTEGLRLGIGVKFDNFIIDYAYGLKYSLDCQHFVSFTTNF